MAESVCGVSAGPPAAGYVRENVLLRHPAEALFQGNFIEMEKGGSVPAFYHGFN